MYNFFTAYEMMKNQKWMKRLNGGVATICLASGEWKTVCPLGYSTLYDVNGFTIQDIEDKWIEHGIPSG